MRLEKLQNQCQTCLKGKMKNNDMSQKNNPKINEKCNKRLYSEFSKVFQQYSK
jgi:hypothetical protein